MGNNYEKIAFEYYSDLHITSRNFDAATRHFFTQRNCPIPRKGLILEVGAGKGNVEKYCKLDTKRVIQTDISNKMLSIKPRENSFLTLKCDAVNMPFVDSSFSTVMAFLYDAFNVSKFYTEVSRVLNSEGIFIGTLPHIIWGKILREIIGYNQDKTRFKVFSSKNETFIEVESYLNTNTEIKQFCTKAGLTVVELTDIFLPNTIKDISPHIRIPADNLGKDPYSIPIIQFILAMKR